MGLLIDCPCCGRRSYTEFWFGGEVIENLDTTNVEESYVRVWMRANVAGYQVERWYHFGGCRRWVTLGRDTTTNEPLSNLGEASDGLSSPGGEERR